MADVPALKSYYNDAVTVSGKDDEEKIVVLFRFATSDYYSAAVDIMELRTVLPDKYTKGQAYRAWESVFMDFDIIQLTFNRDGVYKVIPVVSTLGYRQFDYSAVQIPDDGEWWKILLAVLLIILLIIILFPVLPWIIKGLFWIISLPFKAIAALFKSIDKAKKRRSEKKEE